MLGLSTLARCAFIAAALFSVSLAGVSASAEEAAQQAKAERFALVITKDGVIRVDKLTGAVTFCRQSGSSLRCVLAADERQAWQAETEALSQQIADLKERITVLEGETDSNGRQQSAENGAQKSTEVDEGLFSKKTQKDIDEMVSASERILRGLVGAMKELGTELSDNMKSN
ncbi:MAG: hypothetical protein AAF890_03605 [Pseudomonadota bacterium]